MKTRFSTLLFAGLLAFSLTSCGSNNKLARYDPVLYQGLSDAQHAFDTYAGTFPHGYNQAFYADFFARMNVLAVQADNAPLNDSVTIHILPPIDTLVSHIEVIDANGGATPTFFPQMQAIVDADFRVAIIWEKSKQNLPQ